MNLLQAIESRKSVRLYETKPVEEEKIAAIVKAGNLAPIAGQIHITVIENPNLLEEISGLALQMMKNSGNDFMVQRASLEGYTPVYGAPVMIVLSAPEGIGSNGINMANVACAAENMLIEATDLELGSCFVMSPIMAFANDDIFNRAGIPANYVPLCGVLIGYSGGVRFARAREKLDNVNYCK